MKHEDALQAQKGVPDAGKFLVVPILVLMFAQMGTVGENAAMGIAASSLTAQLGATMSDIQLANMIYPLVAGAVMMAGGMLGIIIGWKKNLRIGLALAAAGELIAAFAPNMTLFIWAGRLLVGVGGSLLVPSLLGIVPVIYKTGKHRALAFGCIGAAMGIANVLPLILGVVMDAFGFRVTFGALSVYFLLVLLASFGIPKTEQAKGNLKFDFVGTALAIVGLFLFLLGVSRISVWGLFEATAAAPFSIAGISPAPVLAVVGLAIVAVLFAVERKVEDKNGCALIPRSFYKTPQVLAGLTTCAAIFVFNGAMTILLLPYAQLVAGWSALMTGIVALVYGLPIFLVSLGLPRFFPDLSPKRIIQTGYIITAIGTVAIAMFITSDGLSPLVWLGIVISGIGSGFLSAQASNVVALAIDDRDASQSGGIQATCRNVGQAIAIAVLGTMLLFGISSGVNGEVQANVGLPQEVKTAMAEKSYTLTSDAAFEESIADVPASEGEKTELVSMYSDVRMNQTRIGFGVTAGVLLLCLVTTRWITVLRKED